jgi:hypothetical protein
MKLFNLLFLAFAVLTFAVFNVVADEAEVDAVEEPDNGERPIDACHDGADCVGTGGSFSKPKCSCCHIFTGDYYYTERKSSKCGSGCVKWDGTGTPPCHKFKCAKYCNRTLRGQCHWDYDSVNGGSCKVGPR